MKYSGIRSSVLCLLLGSLGIAGGDELLIHAGPVITTPALGQKLPEAEISGGEITFRKDFFAPLESLNDLFETRMDSGPVRVSATRAIHLATERGGLPNSTRITRLELLFRKVSDQGKISYYLIEYEVDGSTEHRVVLMNEAVISPRLTKVEDPG